MKKAIRIIIIVLVCGLIFGLIIYNMTNKPPISTSVWDERTVIGDASTAKLHYVQYADLACPYCDVFSRLTIQNEEEFLSFLDENKVLFEIRLTEIIYNSTGSSISRDSAVASYCAKREDKFIDYYHSAIMALYNDYHSKGVGDTKTSPAIKNLPDDYWLEIGHKIGLGETFDNCVNNQETLDEVIATTEKASKNVSGLPFFQFNSYSSAGFYSTAEWEDALELLKAGL